MATEITHRTTSVERLAAGRYEAVNSRGGRLVFGKGADEAFTPTELLLIAIGGCTAIDVDIITTRRAEPELFEIIVEADKVHEDGRNHLTNIDVTYRLRFPAGEAGDKARAVLPDAIKQSRDRLCTVGRTVEEPSPIGFHVED